MPILYVVATPIGNLEDVTLRALRVLGEVGLIAAEDTRKTKHLLNTYNIETPLTSYHEHNKKTKLTQLINSLGDKDIALVSEAGMPGLSDPGYELIVAAARQGNPVVPVPGPSVVVTALAISGLSTRQFTYLGFLPRKKGERRRLLETISAEQRTIVSFESPHRLTATLQDMRDVLGDRRIALGRELTKIHEEVFRGTISQAIQHFTMPKGEFTLVVEGRGEKIKPDMTPEIMEKLSRLYDQGSKAKEAVTRLSRDSGLSKKEIYQAWINLKSSAPNDE